MDAKPSEEKQPESQRQTKWFPFFKDSSNTYINDLASRSRRSPTHGAILQSKAVYTKGNDFLYYINNEEKTFNELDDRTRDYLSEVNSKRQSLHWLFGKVAYDYIYSGNLYIEVVREGDFTALFHMDATKVRINDTMAFISAYWRDIENEPNKSNSDYPIEQIELWNGDLETKQKRFIIHLKNDVPEYDYYGLPDHVQVLKWADIEYKIVQFNLDQLKNGFFPSVILNLVGNSVPEGMLEKEYLDKIVEKFTGEGNNGKVIAQLVDSPDQEIQVTEFSGTKDGQLESLQTLAMETIVSGHRWFASLAGLQTSGSLGSNQQIRNEYNIALKGQIIPQYQKPLLNLFNNIMIILGFDIELGVMNVAPVGIEDQIDPKTVLTKNEQRELLGFEPLEEDELNNGDDDIDRGEEPSDS